MVLERLVLVFLVEKRSRKRNPSSSRVPHSTKDPQKKIQSKRKELTGGGLGLAGKVRRRHHGRAVSLYPTHIGMPRRQKKNTGQWRSTPLPWPKGRPLRGQRALHPPPSFSVPQRHRGALASLYSAMSSKGRGRKEGKRWGKVATVPSPTDHRHGAYSLPSGRERDTAMGVTHGGSASSLSRQRVGQRGERAAVLRVAGGLRRRRGTGRRPAAAATRGREQRVGEGESGARVFQRLGPVSVLIPRGWRTAVRSPSDGHERPGSEQHWPSGPLAVGRAGCTASAR
jgi:hypothetical protein